MATAWLAAASGATMLPGQIAAPGAREVAVRPGRVQLPAPEAVELAYGRGLGLVARPTILARGER